MIDNQFFGSDFDEFLRQEGFIGGCLTSIVSGQACAEFAPKAIASAPLRRSCAMSRQPG